MKSESLMVPFLLALDAVGEISAPARKGSSSGVKTLGPQNPNQRDRPSQLSRRLFDRRNYM